MLTCGKREQLNFLFYTVYMKRARRARKKTSACPPHMPGFSQCADGGDTFSLSWDYSGFPFWLLLGPYQQQAAIPMATQVLWATAWRTSSRKRQIHMIISSNSWRSQRNAWNISFKKITKQKKITKMNQIKETKTTKKPNQKTNSKPTNQQTNKRKKH